VVKQNQKAYQHRSSADGDPVATNFHLFVVHRKITPKSSRRKNIHNGVKHQQNNEPY